MRAPPSGDAPISGSFGHAGLARVVSEAAAGYQQAWDDLVERFASTIWAVARAHRLDSGDAAEVFRSTWLRLLATLDRLEHPEQIGAWLAATAREEAVRLSRRTWGHASSGESLEPATPSEANEAMNRLVDQLPVRAQILVRLLGADSPLSYREISEAMAMPIGSIGPTRARALGHLHRLAADSGLDLKEIFVPDPLASTIPEEDAG